MKYVKSAENFLISTQTLTHKRGNHKEVIPLLYQDNFNDLSLSLISCHKRHSSSPYLISYLPGLKASSFSPTQQQKSIKSYKKQHLYINLNQINQPYIPLFLTVIYHFPKNHSLSFSFPGFLGRFCQSGFLTWGTNGPTQTHYASFPPGESLGQEGGEEGGEESEEQQRGIPAVMAAAPEEAG